MKVTTVIGARPQFIKAAMVSRALRELPHIEERILHTGQHFDDDMSRVFFEQMDIPRPRYHLGIHASSPGAVADRMADAICQTLTKDRPDWVLVYGDTNSTLAGALAAARLGIPLAHVEAGMRSFNRRMPEEENRIRSDQLSHLLFCSTTTAMENLRREGLAEGARLVGDVMYDALLHFQAAAARKFSVASFGLAGGGYVLLTLHRAENTDDLGRLQSIMSAASSIAESLPVLMPLHPRTRAALARLGSLAAGPRLNIIRPVSYFEMIVLERSAKAILTDSGGVQKEAFWHRVPCITLRDETEWVETVALGWNVLCGADKGRILAAWESIDRRSRREDSPYGDARAASRIARCLAGSG